MGHIKYKSVSRAFNYASRAGWLAVGNLVLLVFLALRNTPLAWLAAWSHERLNILHRVVGVTTIVLVIIHAGCDSADYARRGRLSQLASRNEVYGEIGAVALLLMGVSGVLVRRWWYELFYVLHVALWIVAAVTISLHQPKFGRKMLVAMLVAAGMWFLDRLIRAVRLLVYSANNHVTLTPLPHGATRVTLKKGPFGAASGEHCFLYIPKIRLIETHPFTLAATEPFEFVVSSRDGFTQDLYRYALANPGAVLRASVEGAYGAVPDTKDFDTVLLVAGGSGASFTFGMALNLLRRSLVQGEKKQIIFIWIVKHEEHLTWFASHLDTLRQDDRVFLQLYITRSSGPQTALDTPPSPSECSESDRSEKQQWPRRAATCRSLDSEKSLSLDAASVASALGEYVVRERPDVPCLVRTAIEGTPPDRRILVMSCGPEALARDVRNTAAACIRRGGPGVELHCQQFGW
ncbi:putative ferric reductase transmembrane component [Escovopsis weberi]|uniref:Putative ferric reductase transmembrane component n=1 Tax=Escovopsis weberi TaxID=150374 RepID=A0A0M8N4H5_ESCWE|nr:putative ferric reductase transmembrane component [Escovopsis weberi]